MSIATSLIDRRSEEQQAAAQARSLVKTREGTAGMIQNTRSVDADPVPTGGRSHQAVRFLPGYQEPEGLPPLDNISAAYVNALVSLEQDKNGLDDLLGELSRNQVTFANSNSRNRQLRLIENQAIAEFGGSLNYRSLYELMQSLGSNTAIGNQDPLNQPSQP